MQVLIKCVMHGVPLCGTLTGVWYKFSDHITVNWHFLVGKGEKRLTWRFLDLSNECRSELNVITPWPWSKLIWQYTFLRHVVMCNTFFFFFYVRLPTCNTWCIQTCHNASAKNTSRFFFWFFLCERISFFFFFTVVMC